MLQLPTPTAWVSQARSRWQELLVDHANCEKKAASTALALLFAYPDDRPLNMALARLAREELRHFEQVQQLMLQLEIAPTRLSPGRYAGGLRNQLTNHEPNRKVDLLLCGALIEARSCERFELLSGVLDEPVASFYANLAVVERRHQGLYLSLALDCGKRSGLDSDFINRRLLALSLVESKLATEPDAEFRFHSGPPLIGIAA
jgi:tRNA 2-(methylsulfanyl)-N6-isopentenyladenosine37 hydroxylase